MEAACEKRGSMKTKLMMSLYRAAKTSSAVQCAAVATVKPGPASLVKTMSFRHDEGSFGKSGDGYVHGPNGGGGDELVDNKATSYISYVKERLRLEESNLMKGN